jgi:hypothetical protein
MERFQKFLVKAPETPQLATPAQPDKQPATLRKVQ